MMGESTMRNRVLAYVVVLATMISSTPQFVRSADPDPIKVPLKTFKFKPPAGTESLFGFNEDEDRLFYYANGPGEAIVKIPADGEYEITVKASCDPAQNERAKFKVSLDGKPVGKETLLTADEAKEYKLTASAMSGERKLVIEFTNDVYKENEYDRNFYVHAVTLKLKK
jgi:hypothetical protein